MEGSKQQLGGRKSRDCSNSSLSSGHQLSRLFGGHRWSRIYYLWSKNNNTSLNGLSLKSCRILLFNLASSSHFNRSHKLPEFASLEFQGAENLESRRASTENDEERGAGCLLLKRRGSPSTTLLG